MVAVTSASRFASRAVKLTHREARAGQAARSGFSVTKRTERYGSSTRTCGAGGSATVLVPPVGVARATETACCPHITSIQATFRI